MSRFCILLLFTLSLTACIKPSLEKVDGSSDKVIKDSIYFESVKIETHQKIIIVEFQKQDILFLLDRYKNL